MSKSIRLQKGLIIRTNLKAGACTIVQTPDPTTSSTGSTTSTTTT